MKKILITGGAGYIGTVLANELSLLSDVSEIVIYDNLMYKQSGVFALLSNPKIKFIYGDVREYDKFEKEILKADVIFPLAAIVGFPACERDKQLASQINSKQIQFIMGAKSYHTKVILPNSNSGYGVGEKGKFCTEESPLRPISAYGTTKCEGEAYAIEGGAVALRLATVFGPSFRFRKDLLVNDFVQRAMVDNFIILFEANFKRNFIHIKDVVSAMILMMNNYEKYQGQVFNVGLSSANLSKMELCKKIKEQIPSFVIKTDDFAKDLDKRDYVVSNEKLEKTGWKADTSIEQGISELIKCLPVIIHTNTQHTNL